MMDLTLVGKALGHTFSWRSIMDWVEEDWKINLGYVPEVEELTRN